MANSMGEKRFNIQKFLFGSIYRKLVFWFCVIIVLSSFIELYTFYESQNFLEESIGGNFVVLSQTTIDSIDRITHRRLERWQEFAVVNEPLQTVLSNSNSQFDAMADPYAYIQTQDEQWISSDAITPFMLDLINNDLSSILRARTGFYYQSTGYNIFPEAFITNKYGAIVALTNKTTDYNQGDEEWWQKAKTSDYYVSDLEYDPSSGIYSLEIAIPIHDNTGNFIGMLKVVYSLDEIVAIINQVKTSLNSEFEGNYSSVDLILVNKEGHVLYSTENFTVFEELDPLIFDFLFVTKSDSHTFIEQDDGRYFIAKAQSRGYLSYPGNNWFFTIDAPQSTIFSSVYILRNTILFVAGILVCIIFSVIIILSKRITQPIEELTSATEKLRHQDYTVRIKSSTHDELELLGNSFNSTIEILDNLNKEKNQIDKAKTQFLSITSHELRSPMTPMKAQLQMILGDYFGKLNKKQKESLKIVLSNTERLDKIIVDFLEISRIEAARLKFNFVKTNLAKTVEFVVNEMKVFMPEKKIQIKMHIEKLPLIEVDPDRVSQVLRNLINNAFKFTPENGLIEVSAKLSGHVILFSVKDSGIGIPERAQRKLFEPFYQIDNMYQHKSGGSGLGLAISKGIVESQNGKIWLVSQVGKGSIFYFTVPLKPVRDIKAIKLLFSENEQIDERLKKLFTEFIGPLGEKEFENLRDSKGISAVTVKEYISFLYALHILDDQTTKKFKDMVTQIFNKTEKRLNL